MGESQKLSLRLKKNDYKQNTHSRQRLILFSAIRLKEFKANKIAIHNESIDMLHYRHKYEKQAISAFPK